MKSWFIEKISKIDRPLDKLTKERETQIGKKKKKKSKLNRETMLQGCPLSHFLFRVVLKVS